MPNSTTLSVETIEEIVNNFNDVKKLVEGKKPVRPELILYLVQKLGEFENSLTSTSTVIDSFSNEYSQILKNQIIDNKEKSNELTVLMTRLEEKLSSLIAKEDQIQKIEDRERQVSELIKTGNTAIEKLSMIEHIKDKNEEATNLLIQTIDDMSTSLQKFKITYNQIEEKSLVAKKN